MTGRIHSSAGVLVIACLFLSGCLAFSPIGEVDEFGHRIDGSTDDGRQTIVISPPDEGTNYRFFAASYESVVLRPALVTSANEAEGVPVEVLIKGSFPDSCSELHGVEQQRAGNLFLVTLTMRRPEGAVCASVLRPYRFYLGLDGLSKPGSYSMKLNDDTHTFVIHPLAETDS